MNRKDIKAGDVLAYTNWRPRDPAERDAQAWPVRVIDPARERPVYSNPRMAAQRSARRQTGTETVIIVRSLMKDLQTETGDEFVAKPLHLLGLWYDRMERVNERKQIALAAQERAEARAEALTAVHDAVGDLSDPGLRRGMLDTRGRRAGRVDIAVDDLLALIKAARTSALNEMEGTGERHV